MRDLKSSRFKRSSGALYRRVGNEILLASPEREDFDTLSATAGTAWDLLEKPRTLSELAELLATSYEVSAQSITADVGTLLLDLLRRGWIEEVEESNA